MKNWGFRIVLLYVGFVALIVTMVVLTLRERVDLVSKDYYDQELKFQKRIDRINQTNELKTNLSWEVKPGKVQVNFPTELKGQKIKAKAFFFRPSDSSLDKTIEVSADTTCRAEISTSKLKPGMYKLQMEWEADQVAYYNEGIIQVQ
ncbi:MAG: FixH family protein [Bacteroidia bacterium]|nr:FixH family protein [Bacteroidia bacterium]